MEPATWTEAGSFFYDKPSLSALHRAVEYESIEKAAKKALPSGLLPCSGVSFADVAEGGNRLAAAVATKAAATMEQPAESLKKAINGSTRTTDLVTPTTYPSASERAT